MPRRFAHYAIRAYQLTFSAFAGRQCRHEPSCSAYMDEAIARHGLWAGGLLGLARLCRCHPRGTSGYDPVPDALPGRGPGVFLFGLRRGRSIEAHDPH
ncbi:MAG TPA: membrane protein insertion efficiency factor YidD [Methylovirgula sp.]|nr:membrane protein insertion efficiency factor YidD [Methylovirgula sp.]